LEREVMMMSFIYLLLSIVCFALGLFCLRLAFNLTRMKKVKPTGQGMVFRNGRIEICDRYTDDDIRRALERDR